jgi:hypothetical protein
MDPGNIQNQYVRRITGNFRRRSYKTATESNNGPSKNNRLIAGANNNRLIAGTNMIQSNHSVELALCKIGFP